jgi:hypothetical protein
MERKNLQSFLFFTNMNCQDQEFLEKLQVYQKFQPVLIQLDKKLIENQERSEKNENKYNNSDLLITDLKTLKLQPLFHKMLQDYISIIENDQEYFYFTSKKIDFTLSELLDYDKNMTYFNNTERVHKPENFDYYKVKMVEIIKELLNKCENAKDTQNRILIGMIIFKILESDFGELFIQGLPRFRKTIHYKLKEFSNEKYPSFNKYFHDNYEVNKKYISKYRNKRYNLRRLRTILFTSYVLLRKLKEVREKQKRKEIEKIENKSWFSWIY